MKMIAELAIYGSGGDSGKGGRGGWILLPPPSVSFQSHSPRIWKNSGLSELESTGSFW